LENVAISSQASSSFEEPMEMAQFAHTRNPPIA